ncbi:MAG: DUF805 domain-containing protein [Myxococcota bacterium]
MEQFLRSWARLFDFRGRMRPRDYWLFFLSNFALMIAALIGVAESSPEFLKMPLLWLIVVSTWLLQVSATVRRLHDTGTSGAMIFVSGVPFLGPICLMILLVSPGEHGANRYGDDPVRPALAPQPF